LQAITPPCAEGFFMLAAWAFSWRRAAGNARKPAG
jgi:hypothetical protein